MSDPPRRPVWLTEEEAWNYGLTPEWDAAPADAVAAARSALTDCEMRSPGMGQEAEAIGDLYNPEGCWIIRARVVLRALGMPDE